MIRMIATDIDGTIVKDGTLELNPEFIPVVRELLDRGVLFVICSGRQFVSERKLFAPIADRLLFVSDGGAVIRTADQILQVYPLETEIWRGMYEDTKELEGCESLLCLPDYCVGEDSDSEMFHWLKDSYGFDIRECPDFHSMENEVAIKYSVYHHDQCEERCRPAFVPKWESRADLSIAGKQWLDCIPKNVNKGIAIRWLQHKLGITPEETMTFGDNLNDIEMLKSAAQSYAVANARQEVRDAAQGIVAPYWQDGVLNRLKSLLQEINVPSNT